jgi:putative oxidoreductase
MFDNLKSYGLLAGRVLLAPIFILSGVMKIANWSQTAAGMEREGLFAVPVLLFLAILFELLGGLSVLLGFRARLGALLLVLFLVPVTLVYHDFWTYQGSEAMNQMQHFMKNLTIMGGLLTLAAAGAGSLALDKYLARTAAARRQTSREAVPVGR